MSRFNCGARMMGVCFTFSQLPAVHDAAAATLQAQHPRAASLASDWNSDWCQGTLSARSEGG